LLRTAHLARTVRIYDPSRIAAHDGNIRHKRLIAA
jgi:hypothetical protein